MRPIYLIGEHVYLRQMIDDDKNSTVAWHPGPLPANSVFGERRLKEIHEKLWDATTVYLAIIRMSDEQMAGGAVVDFRHSGRTASIELHMAPLLVNSDALRADALTVLVPWLLNDHGMRRVDARIAATDSATTLAAERLGMFAGIRLREFWLRPGGRVDALIYQILNPAEERFYA